MTRLTGYGLPVIRNVVGGELPTLRFWQVPGAGRSLKLRDGSVGFCLVHFAVWWNERVHRLNAPGDRFDEWGWVEPRPVRGQTSIISEHCGGCAMDLDATRHPRGIPLLRGFTVTQTVAIRQRLKLYDGVIGWGGNYFRTVDGMHFEWARNSTIHDAESVARKLVTSPRGARILQANAGALDAIVR